MVREYFIYIGYLQVLDDALKTTPLAIKHYQDLVKIITYFSCYPFNICSSNLLTANNKIFILLY
ncbi:hypothetical protein NVIRPANT_00485 [Pantoea sp. Nvir]|nr:hypothetical protein NVIRPANT_00485 [Pantoea sp. Nvir]